MAKIYNNILELEDLFDIFIFDAYGVFWDGSIFFDNAKEVMAKLIKDGKIVCILSNTPKVSIDAEKNYEKHRLIKGKHYNEIITSGEFCRNQLQNKKLKFKNNKDPKKYYIFGKQNKGLFEGLDYIQVNNMEEADFIYLSAPYFSNEEYAKMSEDEKKQVVELKKANGINGWRAIEISVLMPKIKRIIDAQKPVLNCNPDYKASEGLVDGTAGFILTPGSVAKVLRENGVEVMEYGKPHKEIYDFVFDFLKNKGINVNKKERICMVGDTLRTDIKGANNAGIKSVLCIETGVTCMELNNGCNLDSLCQTNNVLVDYAIKGISVNINK